VQQQRIYGERGSGTRPPILHASLSPVALLWPRTSPPGFMWSVYAVIFASALVCVRCEIAPYSAASSFSRRFAHSSYLRRAQARRHERVSLRPRCATPHRIIRPAHNLHVRCARHAMLVQQRLQEFACLFSVTDAAPGTMAPPPADRVDV